jgi:integrase
MIFNAAVDDRKVVSNPFAVKTIRPPKYQAPKVVPWTNDLRARFRAAVTDRYRVTVDLGAGCGLRQGEIFAVSPDDVDPARPVLHVTRQVKLVLLDAGESIKALSAYLGHSDPGFTLRIYTHLLPASEDRTRRAIDHAFADDRQSSDGLETE